MIRNNCVICKQSLINKFKITNIPVTIKCSLDTNFVRDTLSFSICNYCDTIQLDKLIDLNILYAESHNLQSVGETWKKYFNFFSYKIKTLIENKSVLEIGCPSGKIANLSKNYKKWNIIDPNINPNQINDKNIVLFNNFFDNNILNCIRDKIDIIIHSHLFEHIYEPNDFLKNCFEILQEDGKMFFSIPNMQYIADNYIAPFFGVFFEHTIFYNIDNITYLLNNNKFEIIYIDYYENHSIFFYVKKNKNITSVERIPKINNIDKFFDNINHYNNFILNCIEEINKFKDNKYIYIFGASYNTQILLSMGLITNINITAILDNCVEKQNKYFYGFNILIKSPDILKDNDSIVILKNGVYSTEIYSQIMNINKNTHIIN
jgi:2-polyprenyl-3-methyl-5-hydroxy-6-metoxy-1,4-benzoquinol methylase